MTITNHERVGKALEFLKAGLGPFVDREIKAAVAANTLSLQKVRGIVDDPMLANKGTAEWDAAALLKLMLETWNVVFRKTLGLAERSLVSEIRDWRNKWAQQAPFSSDDAYRALDSAARLLTAVTASHCERNKRATEAMAYNGLVQSWPEITRLARDAGAPRETQTTMFDNPEN